MRVVMGIAPASDSIHISGKADAWCDSAASGEKVRCLCGNRKYRFVNAGDCFPGSRPGDRGDRTPSPTEGYERLRSVIAEEFSGDPVDVLLLGSTYWKRVLRLEKARSHLREDIELLPVAVAVPFSTDGLAVASLYLFPHPRNWAHPKGRHGPAYQLFLAQNLAGQPNKRWSGSSDMLCEADYIRVLAHFELGLDPLKPTSATYGVCQPTSRCDKSWVDC